MHTHLADEESRKLLNRRRTHNKLAVHAHETLRVKLFLKFVESYIKM